ncbi:MAG: YbaB/EbfC family nucleoid-associated protein [Patescibacteria group bacterium]|nr:YbaB/EbfC family nucleoid-associated protein [Patescibacteria group bacterium]
MFGKMQQLREMKQLSDSLATESAGAEKQGVKVVVNGKMQIESIELNSELTKEEQETVLKNCINEAMTNMQKVIAGKMSQMTGLMG